MPPPPRRRLAADRLITRKGRLEDALTACEVRQLSMELVRLRCGQDRLDRRQLAVRGRRVDGRTKARHGRQDCADRVRRDLHGGLYSRLADDRTGTLERLPENERRQLAEVGGSAGR